MLRFHLNNTYWVEGYLCSTLPKSTIVDISKIAIVGQDEAINKILWSVFEPLKLSSATRLKLSKFISECLDSIIWNRYIELEAVRGVVLYGPPGTGKTSLIRYVFITFLSSFVSVYTTGVYATIRKLYLTSFMDQSYLINLSATRRAIAVSSFSNPWPIKNA